METTTDRTVAAEARAVEDGHHAILGHDEQGTFVRVKSDLLGHTGKSWKVRVHVAGPGLPLIFDCDPDGETRDGHRHLSSTGGRTGCKHMALAARRLEREGFAVCQPPGRYGDVVTTSSRWLATDKVPQATERDSADDAAKLAALLANPAVVGPEAARQARSAAFTAAAEGPGGDPFAGLG